MAEYTKEEFWKLYEKLPNELKEAIFSEESANYIYDICKRNKIDDKMAPEVARYAGRVLLGILPPEEFQETLEKKVKLGKEASKKVSREINRFIFYPVKGSLDSLYGVKTAPAEPSEPSQIGRQKNKPLRKEEVLDKTDIYREPIS